MVITCERRRHMNIMNQKECLLKDVYVRLVRIAAGLNLFKKGVARRKAGAANDAVNALLLSSALAGKRSESRNQKAAHDRNIIVQEREPYLEGLVKQLYAEKESMD
jgi:hypothetical protein